MGAATGDAPYSGRPVSYNAWRRAPRWKWTTRGPLSARRRSGRVIFAARASGG